MRPWSPTVTPFEPFSDDPLRPLRFVAFGDSGVGNDRQRNLARQIDAADPDLVVITGDVIYSDGAPSEIDPHYFEPYADLIDHVPFYPALGNHDVRTENGAPLLEALYLPTNDRDGTERYYSFVRASVHFVALDSNAPLEPGSPQYDWLATDLEAASAPWIVVYFHHPPYSSSRHGSHLTLRDTLGPLFDRFRVDLVLNGHDHDYERTFPMRGAAPVDAHLDPDYIDPGGTIYVVTGGGGNRLYPSGVSTFTAYSESSHHFVEVEILGLSLALRAVRNDGRVIDRMSILKTSLDR